MYLLNRAVVPTALAERLETILTAQELLSAAKCRNRDAHLFKSGIERLLKNGQVNRDLAAALVRQLLAIPELDHQFRFDFQHYFEEILGAIVAVQPEAVWREVTEARRPRPAESVGVGRSDRT